MPIDIGDWLSQPGTGETDPCGLFVTDESKKRKDIPVPLRRRDISAEVYVDGKFADTKESLSYISDVDCSAVFRFPLPPRAAVYRFRAVIGEREVITKVKPRAEAREEYQLAVQQGHAAVHMSQHERGASVFEVSLGNLLAHEEVVVEFSYLRLLESFGATLEWTHTATWVPPYMGAKGDKAEGLDKVAAELPTFASKVTYKLSYQVSIVAAPGVVRSVESPQPMEVAKRPPAAGEAAAAGSGVVTWVVRQAEAVADPSKDFNLLIELDPERSRASSLRVQKTPASRGGEVRTVALATFVPPDAPAAAPSATADSKKQQQQLRKEIWFVVDCSGSMDGDPIQQAKQSALLFVRDLPVDSGVKFNVTCFGSRYKSLYDDGCRLYDADSERKALAWIEKHVNADMGGTEILATLQHIYQRPVTPGYTREVIFLTDGGISGHEEQAVYDMVAAAAAPQGEAGTGGQGQGEGQGAAGDAARRTHVLCLGIGHGVHRGLLDGISQRSNGLAAYVTEDEAIAAKTAFLKKAATARSAALRPRLVARGALVRPSPNVLPLRIFPGEPLHVLLEVVSCEPDATLELTADLEAGDAAAGGAAEGGAAAAPKQLQLQLPLGPLAAGGAAVEEGEALAVLHAMSYVGSLMAGTSPLHMRPDGTLLPPPSPDTVKDTVVRLAVSEHLVTPHTSAVGVSLRRNPADPAAAATVVEVPLQVPHGRTLWDSPGGGAPGYPAPRLLARGMQAPMAMRCNAVPLAAAACAPMSFAAAAPQRKLCAVQACDTSLQPQALTFERKSKTLKKSAASDMFQNFSSAVTGLFGISKQTAAAAAMRISDIPAEAGMGCSDREEAEADSDRGCADKRFEPLSGPPAPPGAAAASSAAAVSSLRDRALVDHLNLLRHTEGFWSASEGLAAALGLPAAALVGGVEAGQKQMEAQAEAHAVAAARPAGVSDDMWATVVVLAALRRSAGGQREVWADMEAKAVAWLEGRWPAGARSVGVTVLAVAKLLLS